MIVACPNCTTKYNLPDDKVPADGVKVKCSKCSHLFKVAPPPATPEEEVEVLLDDAGSREPEQDKSSDFDAAFEEAVAGGGEPEEDASDEDDPLADMDFGDDDEEDTGDDELSDDDFPDDEEFPDDEDDIEEDADDEVEDDFDSDLDDLADEDLPDDEDDEEDASSGLFASLDEDEKPRGKKRGGIGRLLLTLLLLVVLAVVAGLVTYNLRLWTEPPSMAGMVRLPFELPLRVPFVATADGAMDEADMVQAEEPMGDPVDRIRHIQPVDFRQYVINNEIEGRIFVVEGQALNNSETPKEQIKVEVALFNVDGVEIASQERLAGNTLSLFQLQVDSRDTIEENLNSSRGTNLNNSYIKPGETTPFMFVFFGLEQKVEEYRISITDARDPQR